jgi:hypothetical protein
LKEKVTTSLRRKSQKLVCSIWLKSDLKYLQSHVNWPINAASNFRVKISPKIL